MLAKTIPCPGASFNFICYLFNELECVYTLTYYFILLLIIRVIGDATLNCWCYLLVSILILGGRCSLLVSILILGRTADVWIKQLDGSV